MLWNIVYEFFVRYIFGGVYRGEYYFAMFGTLYNQSEGDYVFDLGTNDILVGSFERIDSSEKYLCYLETI